eukprot:99755-Pelagomonas_calceolata.AAC.2
MPTSQSSGGAARCFLFILLKIALDCTKRRKELMALGDKEFLWHLERQNLKTEASLRTKVMPWPGYTELRAKAAKERTPKFVQEF